MSDLTLTARANVSISHITTQALVIPIPDRKTFSSPLKMLDKILGGTIKQALANADFSPSAGAIFWLPGKGNIKRILLVGFGNPELHSPSEIKKTAESLSRSLISSQARDAVVWFGAIVGKLKTATPIFEQISLHLMLGHYQYNHTLNHRKKPKRVLRHVAIMPGNTCDLKITRDAVSAGSATGRGANLTRELVNLPGNICTPKYLATQARKLARANKYISATILNERKMAELGMHSLLSVGNGSEQPSQLIVMKYIGAAAKQRPYCLVGKGITFDTGGISIKPGSKMDEMKFDMGGAGSVFGAIHAAALMRLKINIVGVVAAAENMPSGRATKPGDVVSSMSGKTIEILNTDAEGRLVLCDALTYVARFSPIEVVDIATLTGAIIVSLGNETTGVFANDDNLADAILKAGEASHDRGWRMPIWPEYRRKLDSQFADLANIASGGAGSITAACFLSQFTEDYKWAHLDIAGTAFNSSPKGATGRPVPLLVQYLRDRAKTA